MTALDLAVENARKTHQERLAAQQRELDEQIAAELNLVLRGKAYSEHALRYATGTLAELRDVLLAAEPGRERALAGMDWLEDAPADEQRERWHAYQQVMDTRDAERERIREDQALRRAAAAQERATDFFAATGGTPALSLSTKDEQTSSFQKGKRNPQTFVTTLSLKHDEDGNVQQWTNITDIANDWRLSERAYQKRVQRELKKFTSTELEAAPAFFVQRMSEADWCRLRDAWNKRQQRAGEEYQAPRFAKYPQENGTIVLIHDSAGDAEHSKPLPTDEDALRELLADSLRTPEEKRVAHSPGFGGDYQGMRGDGRRRKAKKAGLRVELVGQFITQGEGGILGAAAALDIELSRNLRGGREIEHEDAMLALWDAGFVFTPRKVHKQKLAELFDAVTGGEMSDVSHKVETPNTVTYIGHEEGDFLMVDEDELPEWAQDTPETVEIGFLDVLLGGDK